MLAFPTVRETLLRRTVKNIYEDSYFIYDLSFVDDEIVFTDSSRYMGKQIIDEFLPFKKNIEKKEWRFIPDPTNVPLVRGRRRLPETEKLPVKYKQGRPPKKDAMERRQYFGTFQAFKSIVSIENTRTSRLVILTHVQATQGAAKYSCREVSSFFLPTNELEKMQDLSWTIIKKFQVNYCNTDLNINEIYVLPHHFVDREYYSEENIALRKKRALKLKATSKRLFQAIEDDYQRLNQFIDDFNELTEYAYMRNKKTDHLILSKLYRKKQADGNLNVLDIKPEEIAIFESDWQEAYAQIRIKKVEFLDFMDKLHSSNPSMNKRVKEYIFLNKRPINIITDDYSLEELKDLQLKYENRWDFLINRLASKLTIDKRKEFEKLLIHYAKQNFFANEIVKENLIFKKRKKMDKLQFREMDYMIKIWHVKFLEAANELAKIQSESKPKHDELDDIFNSETEDEIQ